MSPAGTLRRAAARRLAARGLRPEALLCTRLSDPVILSELGLHRLARRRWSNRAAPTDPRGRAALVASLAAEGRFEAALAAAGDDRSEPVLAALAPFAPEAALARGARGGPAAALRLRLDDAEGALAALEGLDGADADLLRAEARDRAGDGAAADALRARAFARFGLAAPVRRDPARPWEPRNVEAAAPAVPDGPLISVVMAAKDVEAWVEAAVGSILAQTWRNLELIVVDDRSADATAEIVARLAEADPRVRLIRAEAKLGPYRARNLALSQARGDFAAFQDADDWAHPQRLALQMAALARGPAVACTARHLRVDEAGRLYARQVWPVIRWCPSSLVYRRDPVEARAGLFDEVLTGADSEFDARLRCVFGQKRVLRMRSPLTLAAQRGDSLTGAADTGFGRSGFNVARLRYWEAWSLWHVRRRAAGVPPSWRPGEPRPFRAPPELRLPDGSRL